ncbi:YlmH/Sll1252 family protein [Scatolibacter rhodanostii]|uniref:YlmH/Sll1252 family protein n=1 Tax=Scatolibacter rhodanostii TaxID=2014781 RepID=UPI000C07D39F|nr:YlmH/Sll1252 family protein [Scatolibacter rhodanostii]
MKNNILSAQIRDSLTIAEKRPHFIGFLTEAEIAEAELELKYNTNEEIQIMFWGGHEQAKRKFLGLFPFFTEPSEENFPIQPITFTFSKLYPLTHSDFLGSFMASGVERDTIGDILIEDGRCVAFLREEISPYFQSNIQKVGKVSVQMNSGFSGDLPIVDHFEEITGVVSSARLDCIIAFLIRQSREKSANFVKSGYVSVNHREISAGAKTVQEGDVVSIRKSGRFLIDQLGPNTSKGRMKIRCRKYK